MGKALIIKGADFSANRVGVVEFSVDAPIITSTIDGVITITSANDVYYTIDGSNPTKDKTKYSAPFSVQKNTTIKACAFIGAQISLVASYYYDGTLQKPSISITRKGVVTISSDYDVHYTTDGTNPTSASALYAEPFDVEDGVVVKAIAVYGSMMSDIESVTASVEAQPLLNKALISGYTSGEDLKDAEGFLVTPWINYNNGDQITWNTSGLTYKSSGTGGHICVLYGENTETKPGEFVRLGWKNGSANGSGATISWTDKTSPKYAGMKFRATLNMAVSGYIYNKTTGERWDYTPE